MPQPKPIGQPVLLPHACPCCGRDAAMTLTYIKDAGYLLVVQCVALCGFRRIR